MSISTLAKGLVEGAKMHKPEIMIGIGVVSSVGAVAMAIKDTPACLDAFDAAKEEAKVVEVDEDSNERVVELPLDWKTKAIIFGKSYWKTALLEALSIFFITCGAKIRLDAYTALLGYKVLYSATKADLDDLTQLISEQPENWQKKFREKAAESHMAQTTAEDVPAPKMSDAEVPMAIQLRWDDQARVYFRLTDEELRDALAEFTNMASTDPFQTTSMNDWMRIIGHEDVVNGDYHLMQVNGPLKYNQIGVKESPTGEPAVMMRFSEEYVIDSRNMQDHI